MGGDKKIYLYSYDDFFYLLRDAGTLDFNAIYMFQSVRWEYIKLLFLANGFNVSGGSHTLRHLLSPTDLLLSKFYLNMLDTLGKTYSENPTLYSKYLYDNPNIDLFLKK